MLMFAGMVVDNGVLYVARRQAQNAADAGALAGAVWLQFDYAGYANAKIAAREVANQHVVWGAAPGMANVTAEAPVTCPDGTAGCIRTSVMRGLPDRDGGTHSNTFPTYMMRLFGPSVQGTRAMAIAQVAAGNASSCIRPWFVPDLWQELSSPANGTFDPGVDVYRLPNPGPATGYTASMIGTPITLTEGDPNNAIAPGNYYEADLDGGGGGTSDYKNSIEHCVGVVKRINAGTTCPLGSADPGCMNILPGRRPQANIDSAQVLIDADPTAYVSGTGVVSGCAPNCTGYVGLETSPRLVPVAMFNPQAYFDGKTSGNMTLPIVNVMAIFIQSVISSGPDKGNINGIVVTDAALYDGLAGSAGPESFLKITRLVK